MTDFDRIVYTACRKPSAMPELYRALIENELLALVPFDSRTEAIGGMELENGDQFPFVQLTDGQHGSVVPIFSSAERAEEALERAKVPPETYSLAAMDGRAMCEVIGAMNLHVMLNKNCASTGEITLPPNLLRDLASGKALAPLPLGREPEETVELSKIDPADFPTDFVQALFEVLRKYSNFRAAWIFKVRTEEVLPDGGQHYGVMVLMQPRDEAIFHEFNMVVQAARNRRDDVRLGLLDGDDGARTTSYFQQAKPFFIAADFQPPTAEE